LIVNDDLISKTTNGILCSSTVVAVVLAQKTVDMFENRTLVGAGALDSPFSYIGFGAS
jgi:hypothetical protein